MHSFLLMILGLNGCRGVVSESKPPADADADGFDTLTDCDDASALVFPGAVERCNGFDDNCDGALDEGFDADADGAWSAGTCADGTDCDDGDATIGPDEADVPYDGIDQDCDGADLLDGDGDGYDLEDDRDDAEPAVNAGQTEIPKNGLDDDCLDGDNTDGDGDGAGDVSFGGDDCDDANPITHPGARDVAGDTVDADCDGQDGGTQLLREAPVSVVGVADDEITDDSFVGLSMAFCDLDEDGLDDWVVTALSGYLHKGFVGIWYGSGSESWGPDMRMTDADTLISGVMQQFFGANVQCADIDGDGHVDLVVSQGEINDPSHGCVADFELAIFYGTGAPFPSAVEKNEADATLVRASGLEVGGLNIYWKQVATVDLDGDGASEIVVNDYPNALMSEPTGLLWVVAGGRYAGTSNLVDIAAAAISPPMTYGVDALRSLGDVDGDGDGDLFIADDQYVTDAGDTGLPAGRAYFVDGPDADGPLLDHAWRDWSGHTGEEFGWDGLAHDLDGDGVSDAVVSAPGWSAQTGMLYLYDGIPVENEPRTQLTGPTRGGLFGSNLLGVPDQDGDGGGDLLVVERYGGELGVGTVWLVSGEAEDGLVSDAALLSWAGEISGTLLGYSVAQGDVDGDGYAEIAIGAPLFPEPVSGYAGGKAYLLRGN